MCFCVDDRNPVPTVLAKVNVLCEIDVTNKFRTIQLGCVVNFVVIIENDFAFHNVKSPFNYDIGYRVGTTHTSRSTKLCSGFLVKLCKRLTFQIFWLAFFILSRHCMYHIPLYSIVISYPNMREFAITQACHHTTFISDTISKQQITIAQFRGVVHYLGMRIEGVVRARHSYGKRYHNQQEAYHFTVIQFPTDLQCFICQPCFTCEPRLSVQIYKYYSKSILSCKITLVLNKLHYSYKKNPPSLSHITNNSLFLQLNFSSKRISVKSLIIN